MNLICIAIALAIAAAPANGRKELTDTEKTQRAEINDSEKCELDGYVEDIINLVLTHRTKGEFIDMKAMVENNYEELEAWAKHLKSTFKLAIFGASYAFDNDPAKLTSENKDRINYFILRIQEKLSELIYESCTDDFEQNQNYTYNKDSNSYSINRNTRLIGSRSCLCPNAPSGHPCYKSIVDDKDIKQNINSYGEFNHPPLRSKNIPPIYQTIKENIPITKHNIIPHQLIHSFTKSLLKSTAFESFYPNDNQDFDECTNRIFKRLQNSLNKMIAYETTLITTQVGQGLYPPYKYDPPVDQNFGFFFEEILKKWDQESSGGNMFVGPIERGPLDPSTQGMRMSKYGLFQYDAQPLLGSERYSEMFNLYQQIIAYVEKASEIRVLDKFTKGIELLVKLITTVEFYPMSRIQMHKWEKRELNAKEKMLLRDDQINEWKGLKFWSIKQPANQSLAILTNSDIDEYKCKTLDGLSKRRWTEFIAQSLKTILRAANIDDYVVYKCDLSRLYYEYRFKAPKPDLCSYDSFDAYLYSRVSRRKDWHDCVHFNQSEPTEWCQAWRRIMLNTDIGNDDYWINDASPNDYNQDVETLIGWLSHADLNGPKYYPEPNEVNLVCFHHNNVTSMGCPNNCEAEFINEGDFHDKSEVPKSTSSVSLAEGKSLFYKRDWMVDPDLNDELKCACHKDTSWWGWLKQIMTVPCGPNSPRKDTLYCEANSR